MASSFFDDIKEIADEKGWDNRKLLGLLCSFIEEENMEDRVTDFLENSAAKGKRGSAASADSDNSDEDVDNRTRGNIEDDE